MSHNLYFRNSKPENLYLQEFVFFLIVSLTRRQSDRSAAPLARIPARNASPYEPLAKPWNASQNRLRCPLSHPLLGLEEKSRGEEPPFKVGNRCLLVPDALPQRMEQDGARSHLLENESFFVRHHPMLTCTVFL